MALTSNAPPVLVGPDFTSSACAEIVNARPANEAKAPEETSLHDETSNVVKHTANEIRRTQDRKEPFFLVDFDLDAGRKPAIHFFAFATPCLPTQRECMGIEPTESFVQTPHWF